MSQLSNIASCARSASPSTPSPSPSSSAVLPPSQGSDASSPERDVANPLHPRVAVILGVDRRWYIPLLVCRALSVLPAAWWGLRCAFTFLAELLRIRPTLWQGGWMAAIVSGAAVDWDVERRYRVTEVALAIIWVCLCWISTRIGRRAEMVLWLTPAQCCASAYLSYFFTDCMMSRWYVP